MVPYHVPQACLVRGGGIAGVWQLAGVSAAPPTLGVAPPPAVEALNPAVALAGGGGVELELAGEGLHEGDVRLLARAGSAYVPVQVMTARLFLFESLSLRLCQGGA